METEFKPEKKSRQEIVEVAVKLAVKKEIDSCPKLCLDEKLHWQVACNRLPCNKTAPTKPTFNATVYLYSLYIFLNIFIFLSTHHTCR